MTDPADDEPDRAKSGPGGTVPPSGFGYGTMPSGEPDPGQPGSASPYPGAEGQAGPGQLGPGQLFDDDAAPPHASGRYHVEVTAMRHPADPVVVFTSAPPPPQRRDWPILVLALIVAGLVMAACCIGGFALFSSRNPFAQ